MTGIWAALHIDGDWYWVDSQTKEGVYRSTSRAFGGARPRAPVRSGASPLPQAPCAASTSSCSGKVNSSIHRISGALRPVSTCSVRTMRQTCTPITTDGVLMLSSLGMQDSTDKQASEAYAQDLPTDTVPDVYPCSRESLCVAEVEYNLLSQSSVGPQRCAMHPVHTLDMHTSCPLIVTSRRPALIV
jgi:hypothetical protein